MGNGGRNLKQVTGEVRRDGRAQNMCQEEGGGIEWVVGVMGNGSSLCPSFNVYRTCRIVANFFVSDGVRKNVPPISK